MKRLISLFLCFIMALSLFSGFAMADNVQTDKDLKEGWQYSSQRYFHSRNGEWYDFRYYFSEGQKVTGWKQIDGKWYHFAPLDSETEADRGHMERWKAIGEYFVGVDGVMVTNFWREQLEMVYHDDTVRHTWESHDPARWEYYDENGKRVYGWKAINGNWYYFQEGEYLDAMHSMDAYDGTYLGGIMIIDEWEEIDGKWYRFGKNGAMLTGWLKEDGAW